MSTPSRAQVPVAIIGMGCRFPGGADGPDAYWRLLRDGVDAIGEVPPDRFDLAELYDPDPAAPGKTYSRWGGFLEGIDAFDAEFFGISPREARRMDPQQRLLLEVTWEALEAAGQAPKRLAGSSTGVFVGISTHDYLDIQDLTNHRQRADAHVNTGTATSIASNRISYLLDLHGPSFSVDTACSSSLTAVHLACRSLAAGECGMAIASGVGLLLAPEVTVGFSKASMLSPRGRCHAFDAGADGFVRSEGCGAVILKPLDRALADGDRIHAVIRGSAINQDGRTTGLTVPNAEAQRAMIVEAHRQADVTADQVRFIEAHGTGTPVGDPIEAEAIGRALAGEGADEPRLLGSAKTNLGHLEAAAGMAGLIKAVLALEHRQVPPNLHFTDPNPAIPFGELGLRVPTELEPWPHGEGPALAGVNSFGFGGANAHVVLEEAPERGEPPDPVPERATHLLPLSGRTPQALRASARRHRELLEAPHAPSLFDHAYTAAVRRDHHPERLALVARTREEARAKLDAFLNDEDAAGVVVGTARTGHAPTVAFVFPGMGPQWWGMGRQLLREEPAFRRTLQEVDDVLRPLAGWSLLEELARDEDASRVRAADVAHVANLGVQLGLAAVWGEWGVEPDAVVGHSSGEMAAACVAGALTLAEAVRLAYHRGRLQHRLSGTGRMLAAGITEAEAAEVLAGFEDEVALAAVNAPDSLTLAGGADALQRIADTLEGRQRLATFLPVEVPYHGPQMEAIRAPFLEALADLRPGPTRIPLVSEVTGDWAVGTGLDAAYWWRNVREPVRFAAATERLLAHGCDTFVEVGPHPVLAAPLTQTFAEHGGHARALPSLRRHEDEGAAMLRTFAELYARGREVDWVGVYRSGVPVPLPPYPWQRERYWFDDEEADGPTPRAARSDGVATGHPLLGRRLPTPHPSWEADLGDPAADYLDQHGVQGATVFPGAGYLEMAVAAGRDLWGDAPIRVEDVRFEQLLFLGSPREAVLHLHLQPRDGTAEIHAEQGGGPWTRHATARLSRDESAGDGVLDLSALRAQCHEPYAVDAHYAFFERRAYRYGPTFRTLREIWLGPDAALARVGFPENMDLDAGAHRVHPASLDGVLQLFGAVGARTATSREGTETFFPVAVRRLTFRRPPGTRFWAYVQVRRAEGAGVEDLEGDAWLMTEAGEVALALEGLRMRVLDEARSEDAAALDAGLYQLQWDEVPLARSPEAPAGGASRLRPAPEVATALEAEHGPPEDAPDLRRYLDVVEPQVDRIAAGFTLAALGRLGWTPELGTSRPRERLRTDLGVAPHRARLFGALLDMIEARRRQGPGALRDLPRDAATLHATVDALIEAEPQHAPEIELLRRGGRNLAGILTQETDAREVMLDEEALELLRRFYTGSPACRHHHRLLADAVAGAARDADGGVPLRVLEIGAGTGAATEAVLPRLPAGSTFTFTDVSPHFLAEAKARFAGRPEMRFATLDIERDPEAQGFEPHAYDLVFAANVLHATRDLKTTLGNVRRVLSGNGLLALMELSRRSRWLNLVFGLLDGWWRFEDAPLRTGGPMLDARQWRDLLEACGFRGATGLYGASPDERRVQTVQLSHAPAPSASPAAAPPHWLVFADDAGVADEVAAHLRRRGDRCTRVRPGRAFQRDGDDGFIVPPGEADAYAGLLDACGARTGLHGVLHAWSLNAPAGDALGTGPLMAAQQLGCGSVHALIRALDATGVPTPELCLVTAGAQAVDGHDAAPHLAQSALWGLGRSLMSEHDMPRCRLVDLGPDPTPEERAALAAELEEGGEEEELALRGEARYVRRLRRTALADHPRPSRVRQAGPEACAFRLELGAPGAIESVLLRELPGARPGPGEMRVRVRASGLNFRDVLQALDMLPPGTDAYDRDPGGIGSECAGVVEACGEGVERFRPGDEIIAFASAAHASHVVAREELAVAKPARLSFTDAAANLAGFVTAAYALDHIARVEPGERVLIHAATGGVGLAALQLCRQAGAVVFATAGSPEKRDYLRALGVEHVMDSRSLAFADEVLRDTGGEGVDVLLNSLSGEATLAGLSILRPYGRFVELGKRDIADDTRIGLAPFRRNRSYHAVDLVPMTAERPALVRRLMTRMARQIEEGVLEGLPTTTFDLGDAEQALRLMAQAKHIGKVLLTPGRETYAVHGRDAAHGIDPEGTYLITGGLGGLGMSVAQWLARQGAGAVVLMSRSGVPPDGPEALDALRGGPSEVRVVRGDVSEEGDVQRVLAEIRRELPPLKGVFHAAMVLDDDRLVNLDRERFERVLRPKIAGAWHLHRLTRQDPLDHFVAFSSIAAVLGHAMQGSYAAANAFLDALAAHRHAAGLPATTVAWGAVSGVGYVARHDEVADFLARRGFHGFTPEQATETLGALLRHDVQHVVAAAMDWRRWAEVNPRRASSPRFRDLVRAGDVPDASEPTPDGSDAILDRLRAAAPPERLAMLSEHLSLKVARILGASPDKVDPERPFTELGFDSLMAVELTTAVRSDLGVQVPVVAILQGTGGRALAERLLGQLGLDGAEAGEEAPAGRGRDGEVPAGEDRGGEIPPPPAAPDEAAPGEAHPLSHEQARFWFLDRLHGGSAAHHIAVATRLSGTLDVEALQRSLDEGVARHDMLRAAVEEVEGAPVQRVRPHEAAEAPVVDLGHVPEAGREAELQRRATAEIRRPFDLTRGPLLRATLYRLAPDRHVLLLVVHHIAADAWAMNLLVGELAAAYDAFSRGRPSPLPPPPGRYQQHVRRQAQLGGDALEAGLAYWTEQLAGTPGVLALPAARGTPSGGGGHVPFALPADATAALRAFAQREGTTLFMVLLAAYQTLLHRHSGAEDICVGTAVSTRTGDGDEGVVGCYLNTLVLRGDLSGGPTFRDLLQRVRRTTLDALAHQEVPYDRVVRALRPDRDTDGAPLFRAMLVLHNARVPELSLPGLTLEPLDVDGGAAATDLTLVLDDGEELSGRLAYDAGRIDEATVRAMASHLRTLLQAAPGQADRPLHALPLQSPEARDRMLHAGNDTARDYGAAQPAHALVWAQADRTPDAVAIASDAATLTYAELRRHADRLARRLVARGVGPDVPVAVYLPRSPEAVVAALGVLAAGGAYLPLDPAQPEARLRAMVEDAGAPVVLSRPGEGLDAAGAEPLALDLNDEAAREAAGDAPLGTAGPDDLAYLIYTSGSTGTPKGVMVPHRALWNQLRWRQDAFPLSQQDAVLLRTPPGFDPAVWETLGPLTAGARLVVPPEGPPGDAAAWVRTMARHAVSVLQVTPSVLEVLLEQPGLEACGALRHVFCGGEPLPPALARRFLERAAAQLHDLYGPAEATIDATCWTCRADDDRSFVPVGRPIANVRAYVLDEQLEPVAPGLPGELVLGGAGVARGYLGRPDLSDAHFVPDPFASEPDARLYRTGDVARWLPDGTLDLLGRGDDQLEVRGMRVEPGEVEAALRDHPSVREAAVVAVRPRAGERALAAFVTPAGAAPEELRRHAAARLPAPMVPATVHALDALPLTEHEKVDRARLAAWAEMPPAPRPTRVAPRDEVELRLLRIWQQFFPAQELGVRDDFFELGGHSLLAMRVIARVQRAFGRELPLSSLIQGRTIEQQALLLRDRPAPASTLVALQPRGEKPPFFCVHPAGGTAFCYLDLASALGEDRPFYALTSDGMGHGSGDGEASPDTVEAMAQRYLEEVRRVQPQGPYLLGGWSMGGAIAFEMARQLEAAQEPVAQLVAMDTWLAGPDAHQAQPALLRAFLRDLGLGVNGSWDEDLARLSSKQQLVRALAEARHAGVVPPDLPQEAFERQLRTYEVHLRAIRAYEPRAIEGSLTLLEAAEPLPVVLRRGPAWEALAAGGVTRLRVPGDHYTLLRPPQVAEVAGQLSAVLDGSEAVPK